MTWLAYAPKIKFLPEIDRRDPDPISLTEAKLKIGRTRLVVLNRYAREVIERQARAPPTICVRLLGTPREEDVRDFLENGTELASLVQVRVHDLKHTFGRWLWAAGVDHETR
ncbi:MAG: hypothetical protein ACLQT6_19240 [Desulfomonilaceae bacterium]